MHVHTRDTSLVQILTAKRIKTLYVVVTNYLLIPKNVKIDKKMLLFQKKLTLRKIPHESWILALHQWGLAGHQGPP